MNCSHERDGKAAGEGDEIIDENLRRVREGEGVVFFLERLHRSAGGGSGRERLRRIDDLGCGERVAQWCRDRHAARQQQGVGAADR